MEEEDPLQDEIELVRAMFSDECGAVDNNSNSNGDAKYTLHVALPLRFILEITLPSSSYPHDSYPELFVKSGPNAQLVSLFSTQLNRRMRDEIPIGFPMLVTLVSMAQTLAEEMKEAKESEASENKAHQEALRVAMEREKEQLELSAVDVWSGDPIVDRKSKFVCHMARVGSVEDVFEVVAHLRRQHQIAIACHPTIWAYRFVTPDGMVHQDYDDDGETGASVKMMFLLDQMKIDGYVIIVTRWFGGILLGPDRFKHIMEVSKNMLLTIPEREKELASNQRSGGGKQKS